MKNFIVLMGFATFLYSQNDLLDSLEKLPKVHELHKENSTVAKDLNDTSQEKQISKEKK